MILGRDLLTAWVLDLKFSEHVIIDCDGPYKNCSTPMADVTDHSFKSRIEKYIKLEESFINLHVNKCFESESKFISI